MDIIINKGNQQNQLYYTFIAMKLSFRDYLSQLAYKHPDNTRHFVLGNTSVDYDSFFGSILLAYLLTNINTHNVFYMPLISCHKEDVQLRFQIAQILKRHNISKDNFHYIEYLTQKRLKEDIFVLVDHNKRPQVNVANIQYIIDHHEMKHNDVKKSISHTLGSNLTNIYYLFFPSRFNKVAKKVINNKEKQGQHIKNIMKSQRYYVQKFREFVKDTPFIFAQNDYQNEFQIQNLLKYGILLDSGGLKKQQYLEVWNIFDRKAIQYLWKQNYKQEFQLLKEIKDSPQKYKMLTFKQTQNKDRKIQIFQSKNGQIKIYFAMIMLPPQQFLDKYHQVMKQQFTLEDQQQEVCLLMAKFKKGKEVLLRFKKGLDENFKKNFLKLLTNKKNTDSIYYERSQKDLFDWIWLKDQSNSISRKKLLRLLTIQIKTL